MGNPILENTLISIRVSTKKRLEEEFGANYNKTGVPFDQVINEALDSHKKLLEVQRRAVDDMIENEKMNSYNGNGNGDHKNKAQYYNGVRSGSRV